MIGLARDQKAELERRSPREYLSKSFMTKGCGEAAWFDLWEPRPWVPNEASVFGSAVDAGVQVIIGHARAPMPLDMDLVLAAAGAILAESPVVVDVNGVQDALEAFVAVPFDWAYCKTQHHIRMDLPDVGMVDAHPDIILRDGSIWDIKTAKRAKPETAAAESIEELGFYALLREYETGDRPPEVGYLTWVRVKAPYWQQVFAPVTDAMLARSRALAMRWAASIKTSTPDINATFRFGPKYGCEGCQYHPALGGRCEIAQPLREEAA